MIKQGSIGVFDSGYGGLTVFKEIVRRLPQYDYIYLGDNARVPYGIRSFETVYRYTWECVRRLFELDCNLVVLACNTASAKALRTIQQNDLPRYDPERRVLGVIRPTAEVIGRYTRTGKVGILATQGTVSSESYVIEIHKFFPDVLVYQEACPLWVPLVENNEFNSPGAEYFIKKDLDSLFAKSPDIDCVVLACTHYPLLADIIRKFLPESVRLISQGELVADSLADYLERHSRLRDYCSRAAQRRFYTTGAVPDFDEKASLFLGSEVQSAQLLL